MFPDKRRMGGPDAEDDEYSLENMAEYEWAEYNLPPLLLKHLLGADDDDLAFVSIGVESQPDPTDGSS